LEKPGGTQTPIASIETNQTESSKYQLGSAMPREPHDRFLVPQRGSLGRSPIDNRAGKGARALGDCCVTSVTKIHSSEMVKRGQRSLGYEPFPVKWSFEEDQHGSDHGTGDGQLPGEENNAARDEQVVLRVQSEIWISYSGNARLGLDRRPHGRGAALGIFSHSNAFIWIRSPVSTPVFYCAVRGQLLPVGNVSGNISTGDGV
jgi:hypothetical protein